MHSMILNSVDLQDLKNLFEEVLEEKLKKVNPKGRKVSDLRTRNEAAKFFRISLPTLNEWTKDGVVIAHRIGNRVLYKQNELEEALIQIKSSKRNRA